MRDFPHLRLGIRVSKAKSELASGLKVCGGGGMPKITLGITRNFGSGSRDLKTLLGTLRKKRRIANGDDGGSDSENKPIMHNTNSEIEAIYCFKICSNSARRGASYG